MVRMFLIIAWIVNNWKLLAYKFTSAELIDIGIHAIIFIKLDFNYNY